MNAIRLVQHTTQYLALCTLVLAGACQNSGNTSDVSTDQRPVVDEPYDGPDVTIDVLTQRMMDEPEQVIVLEIVAPTGGHELTLDEAVVDEQDKSASLYVTLTQPGEDEMVTQALQAHHLTYRDTAEFETVRVYVRQHRRGEEPGAYRLAPTP